MGDSTLRRVSRVNPSCGKKIHPDGNMGFRKWTLQLWDYRSNFENIAGDRCCRQVIICNPTIRQCCGKHLQTFYSHRGHSLVINNLILYTTLNFRVILFKCETSNNHRYWMVHSPSWRPASISRFLVNWFGFYNGFCWSGARVRTISGTKREWRKWTFR